MTRQHVSSAFFFFFNSPAPPEIYTLSLHDALPISRHWAEDAGADRLELVGKQHRRVAVEADQRAVRTAHAARGAHHHRVVHLALLDLATWNGVLDAHLDDIAHVGVTAARAAQHLDAHQGACAAVVSGIQHGAHLDHDWNLPSPVSSAFSAARPFPRPRAAATTCAATWGGTG